MLLSYAFAVSTAAADQQETQIRIAATGAIRAQQEVGLPGADYAGGNMSDAAKQAISNAGKNRLHKFFAGRELDNAIATLDYNIQEQSTGEIRHQAAGVDDIVITSVTVDGDTAVVEATATVWARFAQLRSDGQLIPATPRNGIIYRLTLNHIGRDWFVVDEIRSFAPGSEP
jgi:hypothetical protein